MCPRLITLRHIRDNHRDCDFKCIFVCCDLKHKIAVWQAYAFFRSLE
jgi:hypothetical protein